VFAHEEPVIKLVYSRDGKTLYSVSEGRTIKSWDTERMVERHTMPRSRKRSYLWQSVPTTPNSQ